MADDVSRRALAAANLTELARALHQCTGCDLYKHATQAVMGEGPRPARVLMVGEQPGDREDLAGKPFVGPAGRLLDTALSEAGIARHDVYVTNAVKHFKFEERGKRRIHKKPSIGEINACNPWLEAELALVRPEVVVCLGATAVRAVMGAGHSVLKERGKFFDHPRARAVTATVHPSAILRSPDETERRLAFRAFVKDLEAVSRRLSKAHATAD